MRRRHAAERRFRRLGLAAVLLSAGFLVVLLATMLWHGVGGLNVSFLTAGIGRALAGSAVTIAVTLALAFPIGTLSALYLEEFAPRTRRTALIDASIDTLAGTPPIVFGLAGLALFLGPLGLSRGAPVIAGVTLAMMTMPVIAIATRAAIRRVPSATRDAALSVGASPVQVALHHVLPRALPGIVTGTIVAVARAFGEAAPLLLIGATRPGDLATSLPVQVFVWSSRTDPGFVEKTSASIFVLLVIVFALNGIAFAVRNRFGTR